MTIIDQFINGLGYGACALGCVLMFVSVMGVLVGFISAILYHCDKEEDEE